MRLLFTGAAPWVNSGYGKPMRYLLPRLARAGHAVALAPFYGWQGATTVTTVGGEDVRLYPMAKDRYFNDVIEYHAKSFEADAVISLQDVWTLEHWGKRGFTWLPWLPVDCWPVSPPVLEGIRDCHMPLAYSQWGTAQLHDAGHLEARYMPFGIDTEIYRPADKQIARGATGLPESGFIAGMVAANSSSPSRKSFPEILQAWKQWREVGGEGILYLHTTLSSKRQHGMEFPRLLETLGLEWSTLDDPDEGRKALASVLFPAQHRMWCGAYDDRSLAQIYNSFNVLLNPSMAEGFGVPILEAQACGVPVITLAVTSMPELTFSGLCLESAQLAWEDQGGWRGVASVDHLVEALTWAADVPMTPTGHEHCEERAQAGAEDFDWDKVMTDHWLPLLEELE